MADNEPTNLTALTVDLLSAYFANNSVDSGQLSGLIQTTHAALKVIDTLEAEAPAAAAEFTPAVSVRKSLSSNEHIVSLIDGKPYKTLKRHLSGHGLTPAEYRDRYKLPRDYPMVAPAYSQARRDVAARLRLGRKPRVETPAPAPVEPIAELPPVPQPVPGPTKANRAAKPASGTKAPVKAAAALTPAAKKKAPPKATAKPVSSDVSAAVLEPSEASAPSQPRKKLGMRLSTDAAAPAKPRSAPRTPAKRGLPKAKAAAAATEPPTEPTGE